MILLLHFVRFRSRFRMQDAAFVTLCMDYLLKMHLDRFLCTLYEDTMADIWFLIEEKPEILHPDF